jgi:hypothetical protein
LPAASHCQISTAAFATAAQPAFTLTTFRVTVNGVPGLPSVTSRRWNAGLFSIPVISGYGPIVSSGETTQAVLLVLPVVPVVPVVEVLDAEGEVGDPPPHAAATAAAPAEPRNPNALRRVTFAMCSH